MNDIEKEKKIAIRDYVEAKNEEDTPTQLKKKNAIMRRVLNKLAGYINQMIAEHEDEEIFDELALLSNQIKIALKRESEV